MNITARAAGFKDFEDLQGKYGVVGEHPVTTAFYFVPTFFEGIGGLAQESAANIGLLHDLFAVKLHWKKIEPVMADIPKQLRSDPV